MISSVAAPKACHIVDTSNENIKKERSHVSPLGSILSIVTEHTKAYTANINSKNIKRASAR